MDQLEEMIVKNDNGYFLKKNYFLKLINMNENDEHYQFVKNKELLGVFELLELVSRASYVDVEHLDRNLLIADVAESMVIDTEKHFFFSTFRMAIMKNFVDSRPTEFTVHSMFKDKYKSVVSENLKIVDRKNNPKHIPDFWLSDGISYFPVEIKLGEFKRSHLRQLKRYMRFYKCNRGFAVAKGLACKLPKNVTFINYESLEGWK